MNEATIQRLNAINREFYRAVAAEFDETRGRAWPGWEALLPVLEAPLTVLDVGCGNGRFGLFLAQHLAGRIAYHGIDSNAELLNSARQSLSAFPQVTARLEVRDVVENAPAAGEYSLVALFGMLHHIPGRARRLEWIRMLAGRVRRGGLLAFACWRFYEYPRFRERIAPWPENLEREPGDYLLDWRRGKKALRYCHYISDAEHDELVKITGLTEIKTYRADGASGDANRYSLLRR